MKITIQGTGIELTEAIKQYAEEKVQSLEKYFDNIFENQLAKTAFIGQIGTYTKFDLTPLDIQYSQEEHEFRIV